MDNNYPATAPGPWALGDPENSIVCYDGQWRKCIYAPAAPWGSQCPALALGATREAAEANAELIVKAPDLQERCDKLMAALQALVDLCGHAIELPAAYEEINTARALLAEIEGAA